MTRPFRLGLTGSIGMGKSTTAAMFRDAGIPVWDADAVVHGLYAAGGAAVPALADVVPEVVKDGRVDRAALRDWILGGPGRLADIEALVHPLAAADRRAFVDQAAGRGDPLVVLDIPLLYETGAERDCDAVLVVSVAPDIQRARVMKRPGMTEATLAALLARQMPDEEKRARADYVVVTDDMGAARAAVHDLIARLTGVRDA